MPDNALQRLEDRLNGQLATYDWDAVAQTVTEIADLVARPPAPIDAAAAKRMVGGLREARRFEDVLRLASAIGRSGLKSAQMQRQMAQAFIDLGRMAEALYVLDGLLADRDTPPAEIAETWGLIGRVHKQAYVDVEKWFGRGRASDLDQAIEAYDKAYRLSPEENVWQGINTAALLRRRGDSGKAADLARDILQSLDRRETASTGATLPAWDVATRMEACLALDRGDDAARAAVDYVRCKDLSAFKLEGTRRQLTEVWRLEERSDPGRRILPLVRAVLLSKESGAVRLSVASAEHDQTTLERKFGLEGSATLVWYRTALDRCKGVARIERAGKGLGTGWLVRAADFFPKRSAEELLLVTNAHVLATGEVRRRALANPPLVAAEARANLQSCGAGGAVVGIKEVIWCSPVGELDASLSTLEKVPDDARPIPVSPTPVEMKEPPPRMYVIGHPGGRDLEISLYDNRLIACDATRLHYRTPTEGGSSGSPVFEPDEWLAVGLHHAGKTTMSALDGSEMTYSANEGIALLAIRAATKKA